MSFSLIFTGNTHGMLPQQLLTQQQLLAQQQLFAQQQIPINGYPSLPPSTAPLYPSHSANPCMNGQVYVHAAPLQANMMGNRTPAIQSIQPPFEGNTPPHIHQQSGYYAPITQTDTTNLPNPEQNEDLVVLEDGTGLAPAKNARKQNWEYKEKVIQLCSEMIATLAPLKAIKDESVKSQTENEETIKKMLALDLSNEALINESIKLTQKNSDSIVANLTEINSKLDTTIKSIGDSYSLDKSEKIQAIERKIDDLKVELIKQISSTNISIEQIKQQLKNPRKEEDPTTKISDQISSLQISHSNLVAKNIHFSKEWFEKSQRLEHHSAQYLTQLMQHGFIQGRLISEIKDQLRHLGAEQQRTIEKLAVVHADLVSRDILMSEMDKIKKGIERLNTKLSCLQPDLNPQANKEETNDKQVKNILEDNISSIRAEFNDIKKYFGEVQSKQQQMDRTLESQQKTLETIVASLKELPQKIQERLENKSWATVAGATSNPWKTTYPPEVKNALLQTIKVSND